MFNLDFAGRTVGKSTAHCGRSVNVTVPCKVAIVLGHRDCSSPTLSCRPGFSSRHPYGLPPIDGRYHLAVLVSTFHQLPDTKILQSGALVLVNIVPSVLQYGLRLSHLDHQRDKHELMVADGAHARLATIEAGSTGEASRLLISPGR